MNTIRMKPGGISFVGGLGFFCVIFLVCVCLFVFPQCFELLPSQSSAMKFS